MTRGTRRRLPAVLAAVAGGTAILAAAGGASASPGREGAVYAETNAASGNAVQVYDRAADGRLIPAGAYAAGGLGTGAGLGSQGAVALDGDVLVAVDAGSDQLSVFRAGEHGLRLTDVAPSGGDQPISVTVQDGRVYALNAGGPGQVAGFRITRAGTLAPLPGATRSLSTAGSAPAQVQLSPDGGRLVVTEKAANAIETFPVARDGGLGASTVTPSSGATPYGFDFDRRGRIFVSEAFGGAAGASALSSYALQPSGAAGVLSASVPTLQTAACWVAVTRSGRFAYAADTGSNAITGYAIAPGGTVTRLAADGVSAHTGAVATDLALSGSGRWLYSRGAGDGSITTFRIGWDGRLTPAGVTQGLPASAVGLAAE